VASGGVWVWDDRSTQWYEAPYFLLQNTQPVDPAADLRHMRWPDGVELEVLEPLTRYRLGFADGDALSLDLEYRPIMAPYTTVAGTPPTLSRFEQPSRVTGSVVLHGERLDIDCLAMFDHSWGSRPEPRPDASRRRVPADQLANKPAPYLWGTADPAQAFFVMGRGGTLVLDGVRGTLRDPRQVIERDPADGTITTITVTGDDHLGRHLVAVGRPVNLLVRPSAGSSVGFIYTIDWDFNGVDAGGDVQDVWAVEDWSAFRASAR
jgi:hypothetical protein